MTAEVCVMNTLGIALAADSAVSVGEHAEKIYTSADKLFLLAEGAPVGMMIYGSGGLMAVPWEMIVKTYRRELCTRFDTLKEYVEDFLRFFGSNSMLFPASAQEEAVRRVAYSYCICLPGVPSRHCN